MVINNSKIDQTTNKLYIERKKQKTLFFDNKTSTKIYQIRIQETCNKT